MASSRERGLRPGGVVRALGRLVLLIGLGFTAGLLIGVLAEEPKLLAGHLRGESETVDLALSLVDGEESELTAADRSASTRRDQNATKDTMTTTKAGRQAAARFRSEERRVSGLPDVAARGPAGLPSPSFDGPWAIQVGAFSEEVSATRLVEGLRSKGYAAQLLPANEDSQRWRVRIQPVSGEASADEIAKRLKRLEGLPTWVLPMEERPRR